MPTFKLGHLALAIGHHKVLSDNVNTINEVAFVASLKRIADDPDKRMELLRAFHGLEVNMRRIMDADFVGLPAEAVPNPDELDEIYGLLYAVLCDHPAGITATDAAAAYNTTARTRIDAIAAHRHLSGMLLRGTVRNERNPQPGLVLWFAIK